MANALTWLLAAELIGLIAFPLAFILFSGLKDRGYSVAKPLGLILLSWPLWMLGSLHIVPTTPLTLWAALGLFAVVSGWFAMRRRAEMLDFVRRERRALLLGEVVFLVLYGAWVIYRVYDPSIDSTEKPMDFAFLNASILAGFFPPEDPWLRGHDLPYYYFGYLMMGNLTELTFIPSRISYNLALALIPAMAGSAAYGLVYNLTRAHGASFRKGMGFALVAPVLLIAVSNLQGALEFVRLRQWAPASFWEWLGIKNFGALEAASWRPTEHLWWWRSTRVIDSLNEQGGSLDYTITEFPFFSFLLGDLHPHVMSIPFVLLFLAFGLSAFMSPARLSARWVVEQPGTVVVAALLLGGLAFVNAWDIVTFAALWAALLAFKAVRQEDGAWTRALLQAWLPVAATLSLAILLYLPFYVSLDSQATGILPVGEVGTRPAHFLIIWGLFLVALLPFLLRQIPRALSLGAGVSSGGYPSADTDSAAPYGLALKPCQSGPLQGVLAKGFRCNWRSVCPAVRMGRLAAGLEHSDVVNRPHSSGGRAVSEHRSTGPDSLREPVQPYPVRRDRCISRNGLRTIHSVAGAAPGAGAGIPASGRPLPQQDEHHLQAVLPGLDSPCYSFRLWPILLEFDKTPIRERLQMGLEGMVGPGRRSLSGIALLSGGGGPHQGRERR